MFKIAQDRSMRTYDKNGHLLVEKTVITKSSVNPYMGKEIPRYKELGLEPDKVYNLYRDQAELEKSLPTFKLVQLMLKHIPVDSSEPQKEYTIGSVGSDITMNGDNVYASLRVYDDKAIRLIESGQLAELSAGYYYDADMTQGEYNGEQYDGIMRNIHGNHVALVDRGRIGRDAIISDALPNSLVGLKMQLKNGAYTKIAQKVKVALGMDSDIPLEAVEAIIEAVSAEVPEVTEDEDDPKVEKEVKIVEDEDDPVDPENPPAEDEDDPKDGDPKGAMDAALIEANAVARVTALFEAREKVKPLVGTVTMDSAEQVYAYALKKRGVETKGIHKSAYKSLVDAELRLSKSATITQDSAPATALPANLQKYL